MYFKIFIFLLLFIKSSYAHELRPAIANLNIYEKNNITNAALSIRLNLEAIIAEIDINHSNTKESKQSDQYESLRNMSAVELLEKFNSKIKKLENRIYLKSANHNYNLVMTNINIPEIGNINIARDTIIDFEIKDLKEENLKFFWDKNLGSIILRVNSINNEDLYSKLIETGDQSNWFSSEKKIKEKLSENIKIYVYLGFKHIIPKGLDHILFVLALFLLSPKLRPLILQVSIFTLAHTITLFLGVLDIIKIPSTIVEPIIALSISFVAIENLFTENLKKLRPYIIFIFGLLHGLGFAGVLNEIGISEGLFISSLISFNVGVELGQISVILLSYIFIALLFQKKSWYRNRITKPLSLIIAAIGFYVLNNNEIKVLDKETNRYLYSFKIISNNNRVLVGYFSDHKMINIFTFNKITKYAKYSNTYFDEQGGGQIGVGKCYTKTI
ncbi:HupE/UreJ family protein [Candidatus Pelagibacter ubique]|nr:HupE/UreJ family protein [Candidatus Pelagibacter ubique]